MGAVTNIVRMVANGGNRPAPAAAIVTARV